jgi:SNF2 family DNA or RNA helicase
LVPELKAWRESILNPKPKAYKLPEFLRQYQKRGVEWMAHLCDNGCHCLLADEMGLGKTLQVASLMTARPVKGVSNLVVCPASVVPVWQEEIRRFFPKTKVFVLKNGHSFKHERAKGVWLASYAQLRNHRELLAENKFGYVVLDEGQFIKNPDAKITNTCFAIRAHHRIVMTGTPLENRQLDIWSILRFLLPGLLGTRASFESAIQNERDATIVKLRMQLAPFILRRTKAEVATELPPKVEIDTLCPLTDVQRREYARVCHEGLERLGDDIGKAMREKSFGFLSLLTRLRQVCCDPDLLPWMNAHTASSGKLALLVERLGEIVSSGHKVVIFSQFVMFLKRVHEVLEERFPDVPRFELTGATIDRQKPVQDFQSIEQPAFMLVSLKAAGTGITLHAADYVFLLDPWWNPSVEDQAVDRVHRIGQTRTVFVYRMVTRGTIEERLQALKAEKKQLFQQIIEGVSGDIDIGTHFHSLRELIELPPDAPEASEDLDE